MFWRKYKIKTYLYNINNSDFRTPLEVIFYWESAIDLSNIWCHALMMLFVLLYVFLFFFYFVYANAFIGSAYNGTSYFSSHSYMSNRSLLTTTFLPHDPTHYCSMRQCFYLVLCHKTFCVQFRCIQPSNTRRILYVVGWNSSTARRKWDEMSMLCLSEWLRTTAACSTDNTVSHNLVSVFHG